MKEKNNRKSGWQAAQQDKPVSIIYIYIYIYTRIVRQNNIEQFGKATLECARPNC